MFKWRDEYIIGVPEIDFQHRRVFETAGALHAAMLSGEGQETLTEAFARLVVYARTHFETEERIMQACGYPEYSFHKTKHDDLTERVEKLCRGVETGRVTLTAQLLGMLQDWLIQHIDEADRKIGTFLQLRTA